MTIVTRVVAATAIATMVLVWGPAAKAASFLPAGSNLSAPTSQTAAGGGYTTAIPVINDIFLQTNYDYGGTPGGADQNAFADLTMVDGGAPFNSSTFTPVIVTRLLQSASSSITGGFGVVDVYTFTIDEAVQAMTVAASASTGAAAFTDFTLSVFSNTGEVANTWNVGSTGDGSTSILGSATGSGATGDPASLTLKLHDLVPAEYAVVVQAVTADANASGESPYTKATYQMAVTLAEAPLPAAVWMLLSGLVGLLGFGIVRRAG